MKPIKNSLKYFPVRMIILVMVFGFSVVLYGCEKSPERAKPPATKNWDKTDFAPLVKETDRMLSGGVKDGKPGETQQEDAVTESTTSSVNEAVFESAPAGHAIDFYFPTRLEENNYLKRLEKNICDAETIGRRRKESEGLVSCVTWKATLKKAGTLLEMNISKYENADKAWEAMNTMRSKGGFIAEDVILAGDEQWPETAEGQIEARSFIKSYYGRIRPTYVYKNEMGKPEDYLLENDIQLKALTLGK